MGRTGLQREVRDALNIDKIDERGAGAALFNPARRQQGLEGF
jgi:hypothetical protein